MYIPKFYRLDFEEAVQVMRKYPFAILITVDGHRPVATHIPVQIRADGDKLYATGHISCGNRQKETLLDNDSVMLVFQGPHAYVSSSWYTVEAVPTWDYLAVHAYGTARIMNPDELKAELDTLLRHYESHRENGRLWHTFDAELLGREMKGIVGFEIEVTSIEAAAKMSQNRKDVDYKRIVTELEQSDEQGDVQVAKWMRERREGVFE